MAWISIWKKTILLQGLLFSQHQLSNSLISALMDSINEYNPLKMSSLHTFLKIFPKLFLQYIWSLT